MTLPLRASTTGRVPDFKPLSSQSSSLASLSRDIPCYSDEDLLGSFDPSLMEHGTTPGMTRATQQQHSEMVEKRQREVKMTWQRFAFAMLGGLALIVLVLIIVVQTIPVPVKPLVVVSISILLFALSVALFSKALPENLLAATAAYAAVLVVFISNTNSPVNS